MSSTSKGETEAFPCLSEGCGRVYGSKAALQRHVKSKHGECLAKEGRYECPVKGCNKTMYRAGLFVRHLEEFHEVNAVDLGMEEQEFFLVIQSQHQRQLYRQYASRIVCVDSTHGTNAYDYKLITMMVCDDWGQGKTVAWCISSRETSICFTKFFEAVSGASSDTTITTVMTDDDKALAQSIVRVYGENVCHLLCQWHIDRAFKNNLVCRVKDQSKVEFEKKIIGFLSLWREKEPKFIKYFEENYVIRQENWATAYRNFHHSDVDTNMLVESFHSKLKMTYFGGKVCRRDETADTIRKEHLGKETPKTKKDRRRHLQALEIPDSAIERQSEGVWRVGDSVVKYDECPESDSSRTCDEGDCKNFCHHNYTCSCFDYETGHVCKHLHKVASAMFRNNSDSEMVPYTISSTQRSDPEDCENSKLDYAREIQRLTASISDTASTLSAEGSRGVIALLKEVEIRIQYDKTTTKESFSSVSPPAVSPRKRIAERQSPKFVRVTKQLGRKRKTPFRAPSSEEKRVADADMLSNFIADDHTYCRQNAG
ncbi:uncharacterized protein [Oscarella lobularis]|uniref:uncharacterized protein n=1 Tax=Oscarella lobularis TaxID=121494 RepID=UPI003313829A